MELENEKEIDNSNTKLSDVSENEDELPVKGIANLFGKLRGIVEKVEIKSDKKIKSTDVTQSSNKNDKDDLDIPSNKNKDENIVSNLRTDQISNSVLSDVSKNESDEDEPGLILSDISDEEENTRKQNRHYSTPLDYGVKEKHKYEYNSMCPPNYTSNTYRSESNYPKAFRESFVSKDGTYVRYYTTKNSEYDDSSYFSQSEASSHRDYSDELKYFKYRELHKRREQSQDKEYYDDYSTERRVDNRKKDRRTSKKRRHDREVSINNEGIYDKYGSHNTLENDYDERSEREYFYEGERKSRRRKRRSSSHEDMSDESCIPEEELRDVRKKRSKKEKRYEKGISKRDSSEERYIKSHRDRSEEYDKSKRDRSEESYIRSKRDRKSRRRDDRSKREKSSETAGYKSDIDRNDSGHRRSSDEHKILEHHKERKYDRSKRSDRENENTDKFNEKTSENFRLSLRTSESTHDGELWVTLQNMAKIHNEGFKEYKTNPLKYPNYKEEYDTFCKLQSKKSQLGESSKEPDLEQEWEIYWPKRLNEIVKETWVKKKEECLKNKDAMKLFLAKHNASSTKRNTNANIKDLDTSIKQDAKEEAHYSQLSTHSYDNLNTSPKVIDIESESDSVNEMSPVKDESCLQQPKTSLSSNQSCNENLGTEALDKNVNRVENLEKEKVSTPGDDDGIVLLLRFLLTLKTSLASLIGPIEGLYNEALDLQKKGDSPMKIFEDSGTKMLLQLVVNKFVTNINDENLSNEMNTLYRQIIDQLNNLIKAKCHINNKPQIESMDNNQMKKQYHESSAKEPVEKLEKEKVSSIDDGIVVLLRYLLTLKDYLASLIGPIESLYKEALNLKSKGVSPMKIFEDSGTKMLLQLVVNKFETIISNYNISNGEKALYGQIINQLNNLIKAEYQIKYQNKNPQVDCQDNNQMKEEYHKSCIKEEPYVYKDNNLMKEEYQDSNIREYSNVYQNNDGFQTIHGEDNNLMKEEYQDSNIREYSNVYQNNDGFQAFHREDNNFMKEEYQDSNIREYSNVYRNNDGFQAIHEATTHWEYQDFSNEDIDRIARATMGRNTAELITFIENALTYKGINVHSKEKLGNIFMSVKERQFTIIGS